MDASSGFNDLHVLVVDDDEITRMVVCRMLQRMRVAGILEADGAEQALERLERELDVVDLVICDWNMPGMTGMELFARLHEIEPDLPFLMLTGRADHDSIAAAEEAGIPGYIIKPTSPQELQAKIASLISTD
jgi:two-component system chemotaxis response regulator CheY